MDGFLESLAATLGLTGDPTSFVVSCVVRSLLKWAWVQDHLRLKDLRYYEK